MTSRPMSDPDLLVTQGGHLHRALRRAGFQMPAPAASTMAAAAFAVVTWLPLLVMSLVETPRIGAVSVPFLQDFSTGVRFLLALPLLVFADSFAEPRLAAVAQHFTAADLVPVDERPRFLRAIERALWLRDALLPQLVITALAVGLSLVGFTTAVSPGVSSWHAVLTESGLERTWAGVVYDFFSLPLYRVVILTWLWRYAIWTWFLWRTSRLHLRTVPSHPDLSGGLGFIGVGQAALAILAAALSVGVTGVTGMRAVHSGAPLASFYPLIGGYVAVVLIGLLGPLFMFSPALFRAKRRGLYRYATLGGEYAKAFESKWIESRSGDAEPLLGSADIQSLADLAGSFDVVRQMRPYPFHPRVVAILGVAAVGPLLPLALIEYPIGQLLGDIVQLLL
jgi:hypothetical protein